MSKMNTSDAVAHPYRQLGSRPFSMIGLMLSIISSSSALGQVPLFTDSGQALGFERTLVILTGDIDNDGDTDIMSLEDVDHVLEGTADIYHNDGNGLFTLSSADTFLTTTLRPFAGELVDMNGDGNLDLVVGGDKGASATLTGGVAIYVGDGTGGFTEVWSDSLGSNAQVDGVEVGDIDGNGSLDLVAVGFISGGESIHVCLNTGLNAYLCSPVASVTSWALDAVLVDLDSDDDLDLAVAFVGAFDGEIRIFLNTGGVLIDTGQSILAGYPFGIAAGDLDGDGDVDLAVGNQGSVPNQVLFNDGIGTFTDSGQSLGAEATNDVVLGDIDRDCDLDLIAINEGHGGRGYVVCINNGLGTFTEQESGSTNFKRNGMLVDVDGDGDLDLVTGDYRTSAGSDKAPSQVIISGLILGCEDCDPITSICTIMDVDGDRICDVIDDDPLITSNSFSDCRTSGAITDPGDQIITVTDLLPNPLGIRVSTDPTGGTRKARISTCRQQPNARLKLGPGVVVEYTCGSIDIAAIAGSVDVELIAANGGTATLILNQDNGMSFDESTFVLTAPVSNTETVQVEIDGEQIFLGPGESYTATSSIPAVSEWSIVVMMLLLLTAGTIAMPRVPVAWLGQSR